MLAGVIEEEARCTFRPQINPASEQLLEDSLQVPANFYERQRFFYEMRQDKLQRLQTESVGIALVLSVTSHVLCFSAWWVCQYKLLPLMQGYTL